MIFGGHQNRCFLCMQKIFSLVLVMSLFSIDVSSIFTAPLVTQALAAQSTIDTTVNTVGPSHVRGQPAVVFIDDDTGYVFYRDGSGGSGTDGTCVYRKTTDGGTTWGDAMILRADAPNGDLGYPATVQLDDGMLLTVYYQVEPPDEMTSLMLTRWRLDA